MKLFYHTSLGRGLDSTLRVSKRVAEKRVGFVPPGVGDRAGLQIPWKEICEIRADHDRGMSAQLIAQVRGISYGYVMRIVQRESRVFR